MAARFQHRTFRSNVTPVPANPPQRCTAQPYGRPKTPSRAARKTAIFKYPLPRPSLRVATQHHPPTDPLPTRPPPGRRQRPPAPAPRDGPPRVLIPAPCPRTQGFPVGLRPLGANRQSRTLFRARGSAGTAICVVLFVWFVYFLTFFFLLFPGSRSLWRRRSMFFFSFSPFPCSNRQQQQKRTTT